MFYGLTPLGIFHTAVSVMAVIAGVIALLQYKEISPATRAGQVYVWATVITCLTAFSIFQHGGFGKPHVLAILTLMMLALAALASRSQLFGRASAYVAAVGYSLSFFFHMVPGVTETATRLPYGSPLAASPEAPPIQGSIALLFLVFLVGATLQVLRMRGGARQLAA
jgi:uncharacterized membrane protein